MLHSFYGQEITEPSAQILRLKLNHYLATFCVFFFLKISSMLVQCVYICTYTCVSECAHVDMYVYNLGYYSSSEKQSSDAMHFTF